MQVSGQLMYKVDMDRWWIVCPLLQKEKLEIMHDASGNDNDKP